MTAVVLALLVGLYFLISGLQHKSATIHCQKIAQTPPPKQDFVGRGRSFYSFIYGNTAQFPPSGLSTAPAAAAPRSPYRHLELCGIALSTFTGFILHQNLLQSHGSGRPGSAWLPAYQFRWKHPC